MIASIASHATPPAAAHGIALAPHDRTDHPQPLAARGGSRGATSGHRRSPAAAASPEVQVGALIGGRILGRERA